MSVRRLGPAGLVRSVPITAALVLGVLLAGVVRPVPALATADEYFDGQWALTQIGAPQAWTQSTGAGIIIGIVDTGVDLGHPDLAGKIIASANCIGRRPCQAGTGAEGGPGQDDNGHGTIVSGIAAAVTDNGIGVAGAAPGVRLVVAKALDSAGSGTADDIRAATDWVVSQGAKVVNLSVGEDEAAVGLGGGGPLRSAIDSAWARGAVAVLASGNQPGAAGTTGSHNYGDVNAVVVGATDRSGSVASYSSAIGNAKWGLVAPGGAGSGGRSENVYSTGLRTASPYVAAAGTSMAAPHVSATLALLLAQGLSPSAAVSRLLATTDPVACGTGCKGRLNMAGAVGASTAAPPAPVPAPAPPRPTPPTTRPPVAPTTTTTRPAQVEPPPPIDLPFVEPAKAEAPSQPLGARTPLAADAVAAPLVRQSGLPAAVRAVAATLVAMDSVMLAAVGWWRKRRNGG